MRRRRLLEWINLYLDGEISARDLERLERLLNEDPEARRTYQQYCRLDQATRLVHQRFRMQAPPESFRVAGGSGYFGSSPRRRFRPMTLMAGGMAAAIALVSGSMVVFGPANPPADLLAEEVAGTSVEDSVPASIFVATTPAIRSFNSDTALFDLEPASDGTLVPAAWKPQLEIPPSVGSFDPAPQAWPAYGGIRWDPAAGLEGPIGSPPYGEQRVYRGSENPKGSPYQPVSFQFQK